MAKTVASFLTSAPAAHRPALQLLRRLIKRYFHMAKETMSAPLKGGAFPVYTVDGSWVAGISIGPSKGARGRAGKDAVLLHLADSVTLDSYEKVLGGQRQGRTTIAFADGKGIPLQSLAEVVEECLAASVVFRGLDLPKAWQTGGTSPSAKRPARKTKVAKKRAAKKPARKKKVSKKTATKARTPSKGAADKKTTRKRR